MQFFKTFDFFPFLDTVVCLTAAFIFGTLIGAERQYRQRTAGLRTNALVAIGAASFVDLASRIAGSVEAVRVIAYVVSGVGFLGAGVIMKEGMNVRGLNTAATLWCSAAVGACAGTDMLAEAALLTAFILLGNTLLRPLVNLINRIPIDEQKSEQTYEVRVIAIHDEGEELRELLVEKLEDANYPVSDVRITHRDAKTVEILATLVSTAIDPAEIETVTTFMEKQPGAFYAGWEGSSAD
ncbi:MgtC/SapB family protein [Brucella sp. BE17]|uniref:MgtC/SapB family protein n=1 Tax=Brucella sp. BE17 TaxID=3142977 RepID=UPI0031BB23B3